MNIQYPTAHMQDNDNRLQHIIAEHRHMPMAMAALASLFRLQSSHQTVSPRKSLGVKTGLQAGTTYSQCKSYHGIDICRGV